MLWLAKFIFSVDLLQWLKKREKKIITKNNGLKTEENCSNHCWQNAKVGEEFVRKTAGKCELQWSYNDPGQ